MTVAEKLREKVHCLYKAHSRLEAELELADWNWFLELWLPHSSDYKNELSL